MKMNHLALFFIKVDVFFEISSEILVLNLQYYIMLLQNSFL